MIFNQVNSTLHKHDTEKILIPSIWAKLLNGLPDQCAKNSNINGIDLPKRNSIEENCMTVLYD